MKLLQENIGEMLQDTGKGKDFGVEQKHSKQKKSQQMGLYHTLKVSAGEKKQTISIKKKHTEWEKYLETIHMNRGLYPEYKKLTSKSQ